MSTCCCIFSSTSTIQIDSAPEAPQQVCHVTCYLTGHFGVRRKVVKHARERQLRGEVKHISGQAVRIRAYHISERYLGTFVSDLAQMFPEADKFARLKPPPTCALCPANITTKPLTGLINNIMQKNFKACKYTDPKLKVEMAEMKHKHSSTPDNAVSGPNTNDN